MPESPGTALPLPHGPAARLVASVVGREGGVVRCRARVPLDSPWVSEGRVPAFVAVEIGAQATALVDAGDGTAAPRGGVLVGARDARFFVPSFAAGVVMEVEARDAGSAPPLRTCAIVLRSSGGDVLATATVSVYTSDAPR
jgi:predicted hotdog family 3-hydroxylacyl-ACP dehydratase